LRACAGETLAGVRLRGPGCEACDHLSIVGRTVCAEVLVPDDVFLEHLANDRMRQARAHWRRQSRCAIEGLGCTALSHAIAKMRLGLIDPRDIERWMGPLVLEDTLEDPLEDTRVKSSASRGVGVLGTRACEEGSAHALPEALKRSNPKPSKRSTPVSTDRPSSRQSSRPPSRQALGPSQNVPTPTGTSPV